VLLLICSLSAPPSGADLRIEMRTGSDLAQARLDYAPAGKYGVRNSHSALPVRDVRCLDFSIRGNALDAECRTLQWKFNIASYPADGAIAHDQVSWQGSTGLWWLITESSAVLRPAASEFNPSVTVQLDGDIVSTQAGPSRLPPLQRAPGCWLLGNPSYVMRGKLPHFFDREEPPLHLLPVLDRHADSVSFLRRYFADSTPSPVFWMGLAEWQVGIGGAACTGLMLANYPLDAVAMDRSASAITLYLVVHEHAHELFTAPPVLWLSESLASYLSVRAIRESAPEYYPAVRRAFLDLDGHPESLIALGSAAARGDQEAYGLLYSLGASFWMELESLVKRSGGELLSVLPAVVKRGFNESGHPIPSELAASAGVSHSELEPLLSGILGKPQ